MNHVAELIARLQSKHSLASAGVVVIDGRIAKVQRRPSTMQPMLYVIFYRLNNTVKHCSELRFGGILRRQVMAVGVCLSAASFAGVADGEYACFVGETVPAGSQSETSADVVVSSSDNACSQQLMQATRDMQEMSMSFNLQYLALQQKMQNQNRQYTAMSNVMKTKHDPTRNVINNVR
jgi:hypothetical protein